MLLKKNCRTFSVVNSAGGSTAIGGVVRYWHNLCGRFCFREEQPVAEV